MNDEQTERYRVLVVSRCLPYNGIDHAGGEYLLRSVGAVSGHADVTVVAPDTVRNRMALNADAPDYVPLLLEYRGIFAGRVARLVRKVQHRILPLTLPIGTKHAIAHDARLASAAQKADVIEYQWTEMAAWANALRARDDVLSVVVAHDVLTQRYQRDLDASKAISRPFKEFRRKAVARREKALLEVGHSVATFSEKDAALLRELAPSVQVSIVFPPLWHPEMDEPRDMRAHSAVFVATFARRENTDAARWLVDEIWPLVRSDLGDAELVLAGLGSDDWLARVAPEKRQGIRATGYLDTLDAVYREAAVAVVPMRLGAGVKFKTLTAMLWGIPIVSTTVGVEGIEPPSGFAGVSDVAQHFADAVVAAMRGSDEIDHIAREARAWARDQAGPERFLASVMATHERRPSD